MNTIGLITARGGSKKIPKKNIIDFGGYPLIYHTINPSKNCNLINEVYISSDSEEIAETAKKYGAKVPFLRPSSLAEDTTPDKPVLLHFINWYENEYGKKIDYLVFLRPTSPFRTTKIIDEAINSIFDSPEATSLRTVTKSEGIFHPYWNYKDENGFLKSFCNIDITKYYQKQLLPDCFRLNGFIDIVKPEYLKKNDDMYGNKIKYYVIDEKLAIDIDTEFDLEFARFIIDKNK